MGTIFDGIQRPLEVRTGVIAIVSSFGCSPLHIIIASAITVTAVEGFIYPFSHFNSVYTAKHVFLFFSCPLVRILLKHKTLYLYPEELTFQL